MNEKRIEYKGYLIQINEDPIYHDFQFVVKSLDEKTIIGANSKNIETYTLAEINAKRLIDNLK